MSDDAPYLFIERAEELLKLADSDVSQNFLTRTGESKTDLLLAALTNAVIALAKMQERQRA